MIMAGPRSSLRSLAHRGAHSLAQTAETDEQRLPHHEVADVEFGDLGQRGSIQRWLELAGTARRRPGRVPVAVANPIPVVAVRLRRDFALVGIYWSSPTPCYTRRPAHATTADAQVTPDDQLFYLIAADRRGRDRRHDPPGRPRNRRRQSRRR